MISEIENLLYLMKSFYRDFRSTCRHKIFLREIEKRDGCSLSPLINISGSKENIKFGKNTRVNGYCQFRCKEGQITIGDNVLFAQFISVISHSYYFKERGKLITCQGMYSKDVVIGNDVWIGAYSVIMPGITIGDGVIVGAHSVITKDIPPYEVWVGVPGRKIGERDN